jgi:hypothetical protein
MTRVTSALVLAVLLGTVGVRLGCAWSCQPSTVTAATAHCHETSVAAVEFSASAACDDARSGSPLLAAVVRPDAVTFVSIDRTIVIPHAVDDAVRSRPAPAHPSGASSPPAFATPLRQ